MVAVIILTGRMETQRETQREGMSGQKKGGQFVAIVTREQGWISVVRGERISDVFFSKILWSIFQEERLTAGRPGQAQARAGVDVPGLPII